MLFCEEKKFFYRKAQFNNKKHTKKYGITIDKIKIMLYYIKVSFEKERIERVMAFNKNRISRGGAVR